MSMNGRFVSLCEDRFDLKATRNHLNCRPYHKLIHPSTSFNEYKHYYFGGLFD